MRSSRSSGADGAPRIARLSAGGAPPSARKREAAGILLAALGLFLALSFVPEPSGRQGLVGPLGEASFHLLMRLFSWAGLLLAVLAVVWGVVLFRGRGRAGASRFSAVAGVGALVSLTAFALVQQAGALGTGAAGATGGPLSEPLLDGSPAAPGVLALEIARGLRAAFGFGGALILLALAVLLTLVFTVEARPTLQGARLAWVASAWARLFRALPWTMGVLAAACVWLFSWVGGLLGVLGVALAAARRRFRASRAGDAYLGAQSAAPAVAPSREFEQADRALSAAPAAATPGRVPTAMAVAGLSERAGGLDVPETSLRKGSLPRLPVAARPLRGAPQGAPQPRGIAAPAGDRRAEPAWEIPLGLFDSPPPRDVAASDRELHEQAATLIRKLADFNVRGEVVRISAGPVITQFEVAPAPGVKVNQIANLADDLALAMRAQRIRIVAPIPGKGAVGIEIPNRNPERVTIRELLTSPAFRDFRGTLPIALGKEISGAPVVTDLARMPHLLIAGSTGSGKSVCINALLTSLLYRFPPSHLRLILIDPKMLELSVYDEVPHLLHPVVTRARDSATALKWAVYEMERRFELLAHNAVRNIADFNARLEAGADLRGVDSKLGSADEPLRPLPYVVLVVDELADLMLTIQAEIEDPLARLAQKARAVGIHVVLATQRPSVNVLTGFIKANFPSRISFQVASKTDSRTILDQNGAEALLGAGDMLFLPADRAAPLRIQGAHVAARETEALVAYLREWGTARKATRETIDLQRVEGAELDEEGGERDELFFDAARVVIEHDQGSTSLLQRRLKVGYSRAARIIDQLEQSGVVGPPEGSKPREVRIGLADLAELETARAAGARRGPGGTPPS